LKDMNPTKSGLVQAVSKAQGEREKINKCS